MLCLLLALSRAFALDVYIQGIKITGTSQKSFSFTQPAVAYENYDYMNSNTAYYDWPDWAPPVLTAVVTVALYGGIAYLVYDLTKKNVSR